MKIGIYPGSFDPITKGHLDIIERASRVVDELVIGVLNNSEKRPMFSAEERVSLIKEAVCFLPNVRVEAFDGLTVDFAKQNNSPTTQYIITCKTKQRKYPCQRFESCNRF